MNIYSSKFLFSQVGPFSSEKKSKAQSGQHQISNMEGSLWAVPTHDDWKTIEKKVFNPFHNTLVNYVESTYATANSTSLASTRSNADIALDSVILADRLNSNKTLALVARLNGIEVSVDETFLKMLTNFSFKLNKRERNTASKLGINKISIMQAKQTRLNENEICDTFVAAYISKCTDPSMKALLLSSTHTITSFGVINLALELLCKSEAGMYVSDKMSKYSLTKIANKIGDKSFCPELRDLSLPLVFEIRLALAEIATSDSVVLAAAAARILEVFNPFTNFNQETRLKLERYSTIFIKPQMVKHVTSSREGVRPEQKEWIQHMKDMYTGYAEHIIQHNDLDTIPAFNHLKALPAQMGSGKTTVAAIATGPIQKHANDALRIAGIDGTIITTIVEPSLKVSVNFAATMQANTRPWLIINKRVVPMFSSCPVELTGWKRNPERFIKSGDYDFSHEKSTKGRDKELRNLSILEQFDWFMSWSSKTKNLKPSRSGFSKPTHIFCDPQSASELFSYKSLLRQRGIFIVGMIDEVVACADCGEANPVSNPLAYWYAKLTDSMETGWLLSASYSNSHARFEEIEVLPSEEDAVSFTQLRLHSSDLVSPLNGLAQLSVEDRISAISSWSTRVLRLIPPTMIYQIIDIMKEPFEITERDVVNSISYLVMVRRLCNAVANDPNADLVCNKQNWKFFKQNAHPRDSILNIYTGNPSAAALEILGDEAITSKQIEYEIANYDKVVDRQVKELRQKKTIATQMAKDRECGSMSESPDNIQEEIERLIQSKSRPDEHIYTFTTRFGMSIVKGATMNKLLTLTEAEIAIALSGIEFDSLAFSPVLTEICSKITCSNSSCEFVGVGNVYGVNDASIQHVVVRGDPRNLGRESVCQAAGRTARAFDGRNQIGYMSIPKDVLRVFGQTSSIMDYFADNIEAVHSRATVCIQALFKGYIHRKRIMEICNNSALSVQTVYRGYTVRKYLGLPTYVIQIQKVFRSYIVRKRIRHRNERRARQRAEQIQNRRDIERRERNHKEEQNAGEWHSVRGRRNTTQNVPPVVAPSPHAVARAAPRMRGRIQNWINHKDFGFINVDGGARLFIHRNRISQHGYIPSRGDFVEFDIMTNHGSDEACNLTLVPPEKHRGRIQNWISKENYGFIDVQGGGRLFIHIRRINEDNYIPRKGDVVEFNIITSRGKQEASELTRV